MATRIGRMTALGGMAGGGGPVAPPRPALSRIRHGLTRREWVRVGGMAAVVVGLTVVGWGVLLLLVVPGHYGAGSSLHPSQVGTKTFGIGVGVTAYTLGMRHAFDADHIAAIDNTTRKLMARRERPLSVGFWFSLGHSTVVFALTFLLGIGVKALVGPVANDNSGLHRITGVVGTGVSGVFLYVIAAINLVVLAGIVRVFRQLRRGTFDEAALEEHLDNRGLLNRVFGRLMGSITRPWQMYPVGLLFGLGFDTATEVALLVLAGTGAAANLPWYAILCLPVLFAAGMSLFDSIDGSFMNFAYGWAFSKPVRKVFYNLTITGLSVAVALLIGTVELLGLLATQLGWRSGFWGWVAGLDINALGFVIVGLFVVTWLVALAVWRFGRIEDRWTARLRPSPEPLD